MKIVVTNNQDFSDSQIARLNSLGDVSYFDPLPQNSEEYLERVEGADIICSGTAGLKDAFTELHDVYITVGFVSVAFVDLKVLAQNKVKISNAPGINRHAVSEWIIWMMLLIARDFNDALNREKTYRVKGSLPPLNSGLAGKNLTILGNGMIGKQVKNLAEAFDMSVTVFKRGDDLYDSVKEADFVVDALSSNPSTENMLDDKFFAAMKKGSSFVSITRSEVVDEDVLIEAIDSEHLNMAAMDCGGILVGDTEDHLYKKYLRHPKILVTPHTSWSSEMSSKLGNDIMIDNVEAWISGNPQNVLN